MIYKKVRVSCSPYCYIGTRVEFHIILEFHDEGFDLLQSKKYESFFMKLEVNPKLWLILGRSKRVVFIEVISQNRLGSILKALYYW